MAESIMVLPPYVRSEEIGQRGDRAPPGDFLAYLEPLGMLVEHRIDNVDERFVAGKQTMASREKIAFQPSLAEMLAQNFHDAAIRRDMIVGFIDFRG